MIENYPHIGTPANLSVMSEDCSHRRVVLGYPIRSLIRLGLILRQ